MTIEGQVSIFDLLKPEKRPEPPVDPHASYEMLNPCPACGEKSATDFMAGLNHWGMPSDREKFGHEVCVSMNLKLNHVHHALARAGRKWDEDTPCCYDKNGLHGKAVRKPTREQWLDHARFELIRTRQLWHLHMDSLIQAVAECRERYGITPHECPVLEGS